MCDVKKSHIIKSTSLLILFCGLFFLSLCSCQNQSDDIIFLRENKDTLDVKFMTFNIPRRGSNSWNNRRQMVFDVLRNHQCDVIGFQEITRSQLDDIAAEFPEYAEIGVAREDGQTRGEYTAVLYRRDRFMKFEEESGTFWLSETPQVPGSRSWNTAYVRICTWARLIEISSGKSFYIYNTHLDNVSQLARERGAALVIEHINNRDRELSFVLTGDFNANETESTIMYIKGLAALDAENGEQLINPVPMIDTFRQLYPDETAVRTRHDWSGDREGEKIDYIFASPDVEVLEAEIVYDNVDGNYPSDHYPLTAAIRLPGN